MPLGAAHGQIPVADVSAVYAELMVIPQTPVRTVEMAGQAEALSHGNITVLPSP